jgi:hypothetical protein
MTGVSGGLLLETPTIESGTVAGSGSFSQRSAEQWY